jgi:ribosomal protein S18 acetylase RimI-like enzyme
MLKIRGRNKILIDGWLLQPYAGKPVYKFDCGDKDLNSFFQDDVKNHDQTLMVKTFILSPLGLRLSKQNPPSAFISFLNDSIRKEDFANKRGPWKKLTKKIPHPKRYKVLPAVKIGRLGVDIKYRHSGMGAMLLNMTRELFLTENRTGCRFLTVDAYITKNAIDFYTRNGFQFFPDEEKRCEEILKEASKTDDEPKTVAMWFDLFRVKADIDKNLTPQTA